MIYFLLKSHFLLMLQFKYLINLLFSLRKNRFFYVQSRIIGTRTTQTIICTDKRQARDQMKRNVILKLTLLVTDMCVYCLMDTLRLNIRLKEPYCYQWHYSKGLRSATGESTNQLLSLSEVGIHRPVGLV